MSDLYPKTAMFYLLSCFNGLTKLDLTRYHKIQKRLPLSTHETLAATLATAAYYRCRANTKDRSGDSWRNQVQCARDNIVQTEYPSEDEMPNEVFCKLYYRRSDFAATQTPRQALAEVLAILKEIENLKDFDPRYCRIVKFLESRVG